MAANLDGQLVVAISSRALFDFEEENLVFEAGLVDDPAPGAKKDAAYMLLQLERLDLPAKPGVAFSLVQKLLAFNEAPCHTAESQDDAASPAATPDPSTSQRVEVVILSRNDPVSGMRVFRSADANKLRLERGVFTKGRAPYNYLRPLKANLFLSANPEDVRAALDAGFAAATVAMHSVHAKSTYPNEVRIAFDGDAVLFSDEAERVFQS
ncbi:MAG: 5'-nucleotidase, partial [Polaromonas sp.]